MTDDDIPGLDLTAFRAWYDGQRPGEIAGELSAKVIAGGKSNLTYEVTDGTSWWIVRRPPLGHVQATAHDMGREYTAMSALADTAVPVPATYAHCADPDVLGAPFYVMERVDGVAYRSASQLEPLGPERTAAIAGRMIDVLAALHAVDPVDVGLAEFGRPHGFLERQVRRWGKQLEGSKTTRATERRRAAPAARRTGARGRRHLGRDRARRLPPRQPAHRSRRPDQGRRRLGDGHPRRHPHRPRAAARLRPDRGGLRRRSWSPT